MPHHTFEHHNQAEHSQAVAHHQLAQARAQLAHHQQEQPHSHSDLWPTDHTLAELALVEVPHNPDHRKLLDLHQLDSHHSQHWSGPIDHHTLVVGQGKSYSLPLEHIRDLVAVGTFVQILHQTVADYTPLVEPDHWHHMGTSAEVAPHLD